MLNSYVKDQVAFRPLHSPDWYGKEITSIEDFSKSVIKANMLFLESKRRRKTVPIAELPVGFSSLPSTMRSRPQVKVILKPLEGVKVSGNTKGKNTGKRK